MAARLPITAMLATTLALGGASCAEQTVMDIRVEGDMRVEECGELTPWSPGFATWAQSELAPAVMRFQTFEGAASFDDDVIAFIIDNPDAVRDGSLATLSVGDRELGDDASAQWTWQGSCPPDFGRSGSLRGTLTFEKPPTRDGELVEGEFTGEVVDGRDETITYANTLQIRFRFTYRTPVPYQVYSGQ